MQMRGAIVLFVIGAVGFCSEAAFQPAAAQCQSTTNVRASCYDASGTMNHLGQLGRRLARQKNFKGALDAYTKAIALSPSNPSLYNNRAQVLEELGDREKAIEDYNKAISINPRDEVFYLNRGYNYFELNRFALARSDYEKSLSINPKGWLPRGRLSELFIAMGEYEKALEILNSMIAQNPADGDMRRLRAKVRLLQKQFDQALVDLKCETFALEFRLNCYPARAEVQLARDEMLRASKDIEVAFRLNPKSDYAFKIRGDLKNRRNDALGALLDYSKAIELDPVYIEAYLRRGDVLLRMGRETDALKDYDRAASLERKSFRELAFRKEAREKADKIHQAYLAKWAKSPIMIFFDYGLTDFVKSVEPLVDMAAEIVLKGHAKAVQVTGHADVVERSENPEIATARAFAIRSALIRAGVPAEKIKTGAGAPNEGMVPDVAGQKEPQNRLAVLTFVQ